MKFCTDEYVAALEQFDLWLYTK